jgi:hypothetical protein
MYEGRHAARDARHDEDAMMPLAVDLRPARDVRLVEQAGAVLAYPGPHQVPVLPAGWAPLSREQQRAVLRACEGAADSILFRLGSLWEPGFEYRVSRLGRELWAGLSVVSKCLSGSDASKARASEITHELLGLAQDPIQAVRIAVDFFNWDLEAHGQAWRLDVQVTTPNHA